MASALSALTSLSRRRVEYWQEAQRGQMQPKKIEPRMTRMTRMKNGFNAKAQSRQDAKTEETLCVLATLSRFGIGIKNPAAIRGKILAKM